MAGLAAALPYISGGMTAISAVSSIQGANQQASAIKAAGRNQQIIANYQADLSERQGVVQQQELNYRAQQGKTQAGQQRASAQRSAIEQKRRGKLAESAAINQAAAGGGTVGDFYNTIAGIGAESEYAKMAALFEGEDAARGFESQSALDIYSGEEARRAAKYTAAGYRAGGQTAVNTAATDASTARRAGYTSALATVGSFAASYGAQTLMNKYAPEKINWNPEPFGPYKTVRV